MSVQTAHIPAACVPGLAVGAEDSLYEVCRAAISCIQPGREKPI